MIATAISRIEGSAILQHHDGQNPSCARTRTTAKGKTRYEFDYPLEDTHLAGEAPDRLPGAVRTPEGAPRTAAGPK